jgi:hypothetical protein
LFLILLVAASVWLLSAVFVFVTIMLAAWYHGRHERLQITSRPNKRRQPKQAPAGLRAPGASTAGSTKQAEQSLRSRALRA